MGASGDGEEIAGLGCFRSFWVLFDMMDALKGYAGGSVVSVRSTDRTVAYRDL
jgi:hypothetical protein